MKFKFPENLYCDVRIEDNKTACYAMQNDEVLANNEVCIKGAMIRIFDGKLWYTAETNDIDKIQNKINELAKLAAPDPKILENPIVKNYRKKCMDKSIKEIKVTNANFWYTSTIKELYTSKGTEIIQDYQRCALGMWFQIAGKDNVTYGGGERLWAFDFKGLKGREQEIIEKRDRAVDYALNNVAVEPGDYVCVLSPSVTSVFTHESFGHKSEADFMLNDKTLRDEWTMGKQVANPKVSIVDEGDSMLHGYCPYDDEGNKKKEVWLIKDGIYVYDWNYGTGNVFQTLFDIDAVGDDLQFFSGTCGKNGQSLPTTTGGPTIRVKKLTIN